MDFLKMFLPNILQLVGMGAGAAVGGPMGGMMGASLGGLGGSAVSSALGGSQPGMAPPQGLPPTTNPPAPTAPIDLSGIPQENFPQYPQLPAGTGMGMAAPPGAPGPTAPPGVAPLKPDPLAAALGGASDVLKFKMLQPQLAQRAPQAPVVSPHSATGGGAVPMKLGRAGLRISPIERYSLSLRGR